MSVKILVNGPERLIMKSEWPPKEDRSNASGASCWWLAILALLLCLLLPLLPFLLIGSVMPLTAIILREISYPKVFTITLDRNKNKLSLVSRRGEDTYLLDEVVAARVGCVYFSGGSRQRGIKLPILEISLGERKRDGQLKWKSTRLIQSGSNVQWLVNMINSSLKKKRIKEVSYQQGKMLDL